MKEDAKYKTLLNLIRREKIISRKDYEGVRCANHYPLGTFDFFKSKGMRIKKGEKSFIRNELGQALFTSDQTCQFMCRSMVEQENSMHRDCWDDCY